VIFTETKLKGAFIIELERRTDERGFFARVFCQQEFHSRKGTLGGMHFQYPPATETKFVRCTRGALLDIIVAPKGPDLP
jgi:dTDP-4-dehydrorhamnose 3,5-epimerase